MFLISFDSPLQHLQDDIEDLKSHLLVLGKKVSLPGGCPKPQTVLRKSSVSALLTVHPILSFPRPVLFGSPLEPQLTSI